MMTSSYYGLWIGLLFSNLMIDEDLVVPYQLPMDYHIFYHNIRR